ncbi:MAG: TetR/AcrR family transcriptional regulator [Promethearchaeota archaeon]|nr:MAG: TetR/AcrR family transcriptional regulator [Candidatus Lokiarchaeota archaeon]
MKEYNIERKKRTRSKEEKALQMEKILTASLELIKTKGFHGFGMRALARHINMSQGNLYHYISSKRELWIAVRIKTMRHFKELLEEIAFSKSENTLETLRKIGNFVFTFASEDYNRWKLMTVIKPPEPPMKDGKPVIGEIEKNYESTRVLDVVFEILRGGFKQGELKNLDFKLIGIYLYSTILGVTYSEYDLLTDDLMREATVHDGIKFDKKELREFFYSQMEQLLRKKDEI